MPWSRNASIYEVNIRQYTPQGTFNAFDRAHEAMMKGAAIAMEKIPALKKDLGL